MLKNKNYYGPYVIVFLSIAKPNPIKSPNNYLVNIFINLLF